MSFESISINWVQNLFQTFTILLALSRESTQNKKVLSFWKVPKLLWNKKSSSIYFYLLSLRETILFYGLNDKIETFNFSLQKIFNDNVSKK